MKSYSLERAGRLFGPGAIFLFLLATGGPSWAADLHVLPGHIPWATTNLNLQSVGRLASTNRLTLAIGLPWRNQEALVTVLDQIYNPASPGFHQYLTPAQFAESFGPTADDYQAVIDFANSNGLALAGTHPNRLLVDVSGSVAEIEQAFHVTLRLYQHPTENRTFYAPDAEPSLALTVPILHISGLDNYAPPRPYFHATPVGQTAGAIPAAGSGPGGGYLGYDFRNAYAPGVSLTGAGQKVGLLEFDGYYPRDITAYESLAGLPGVTLSNVFLNGFNGTPGGNNVEVALDIDMAICMAPGLSEVLVYQGFNPDDVLNRMATDNLAKQLSSSWGWSPLDPIALQIFQQFAAQGQSMYQASGDNDAFAGPVTQPSDDPYITIVGGTTLTMTTNGGSYLSERVWNWGGGIGTGGGISTRYAIPTWQQGIDMTANLGSTTMRNLPDVALTADNVFLFANNGQQLAVGGTSCAAPLWAGFTALINQLALANNEPVAGFINPAVYALAKSGAYAAGFHDITVGNNESPSSPSRFPAVPGYDLCTGWGTPTGSNLIYALGFPEPLRLAPATDLLFTGPAGGPLNPAAQSYSLTNNGSGALAWTVSRNATWFTTSPAGGILTAGGPATLVTVKPNALASNLAAGTYTATLAFTNQNNHFGQNRQVTLAIVTSPVITSQPASQAVLQGMAASFNVGTASNALLYCQWQFDNGSYLTNLTDSGNISGSGTSTLTINNVSPTNVGAYSVVVSNAAGTVTSSTAYLTIVPWRPVIVTQPTNQTVLPGAPATFNVAAVGSQPFSYRWQVNGTNLLDGGSISGSGTGALTVTNVTLANVGTYSVLISNSLGSAVSTGAALAVISVTAPGAALDTLYSFSAAPSGFNPYAGLTLARDGNLYGTTLQGGSSGFGTVFRLAGNGSVTFLHSFTAGADGAIPYAPLSLGSNGQLYGTTFTGGSTGDGVVFRIGTNGFFTPMTSLNFSNSGGFPVGGILQGRDGNFYATALQGGISGYGTIFRVTGGNFLSNLRALNSQDGSYPSSMLLQAPDGDFYGTAENGGTNGGWGTLFRISPSGNLSLLYSFGNIDGGVPIAGVVQDSDGAFYGTTYVGGTNAAGTVFKWTPDGTFKSLYSFSGAADGSNPFSGLVLSTDGNLYGATESGGAYGYGTVFRISPNGKLVTMAHFDGYQGANPEGTLIQAADGNLYGTTVNGGPGSAGAIYRLSINSPLQITHQPETQLAFLGDDVTFSVATYGSLPVSYQWRKNGRSLADGGSVSGSNLRTLSLTNVTVADAANYSVIVSNSYGSVLSSNAALELIVSPPFISLDPLEQTVLAGATVSLNVEAGGDEPLVYQWQKNGTNVVDGIGISGSLTRNLTLSSVTLAAAGTYSVIVSNDIDTVSSAGAVLTVVPLTPPGVAATTLRAFPGGNAGQNPYAGLVQGRDGNLYGTTLNGGAAGYGTAYRLTTGGGFTLLHAFSDGLDGGAPFAGLVQGTDGNFFGAAFQGGALFSGELFRMNSGGAITPLYSFTGGADGSMPVASLIQASDSKLYGAAYQGGSDSYGSVFSLTTNGIFTPLTSFSYTNGSYPVAPLLQGSDGNLYGTTYTGGEHGYGTVLSLTTNGVLTTLASFNYNDGAYPVCGLVQDASGAFYGTTSAGGTNGGWGTVFRLAADGTLTSLYSFGSKDGATPFAGLLLATDGSLFGTTADGGVGGEGTAFRITTNGVLTTVLWFNGPNGANPEDALIQARDGSFYGTAEYGGLLYNGAAGTGNGLVFRLTLPMFLSNPFAQATATVGVAYAGTLATNAVVPAGDTLAFAKVLGPAWLTITPDGTLSGTPAFPDIGTNNFAVSLADTNGWSSAATMRIAVVPSPFITLTISCQGTNLCLNWSGGKAPYQVQMGGTPASPLWQTIAGPMTNTTLILSPTSSAGFYRVQGQ
jgi:uncharacterized repeat protein (TIGR03803 family)